MKILLATSMSIPHTGGASTHFELLAGQLQRHGLCGGFVTGREVQVSRLRRVSNMLQSRLQKDAYRALCLDQQTRELSAALEMTLKSCSADVIHSHDPVATYAASRLTTVRSKVVKLLQTVHGPWSREILTSGVSRSSRYYKLAVQIEGEAYSACDRLISVDSGQKDIVVQNYAIKPDKVNVIHNAVSLDDIDALRRSNCGLRIERPYFVVPRRLVPKNGVQCAIEAMKLLPPFSATLVVAGDGPLLPQVRALANDAKDCASIQLLGSVPQAQLYPLMANCSAVIVPSVPCEGVIEATSLSVLEAFACNVPVIVSNIGGLSELVEDGRTGFRFPAGDSRALSVAMSAVLAMTERERDDLCREARSRALQRWDVKPWFASIRRIYESVCA